MQVFKSFTYSTYKIDQGPDCSFFSLEGRLISLIDIGSQTGKAIVVTAYALSRCAFKLIQSIGFASLALIFDTHNNLNKAGHSFRASGSYFCSALQCGLFHRITAIAGDILGFVIHPVIGQRTRQEIDAISSKVRDLVLPLIGTCASVLFLAKYPHLMNEDGIFVPLPLPFILLELIVIENAWNTPNRFYKGLFHYKSMNGVEDQARRDYALSFYNTIENSDAQWAKDLLAPLDRDCQKALNKVPHDLDPIEFNLYVRAHDILTKEEGFHPVQRFQITAEQRKKINLALLKDGWALKMTIGSIFDPHLYTDTINDHNYNYAPIENALLKEPITLERFEGALRLFYAFNAHIEKRFNRKYDIETLRRFDQFALLYGDQETQLAAAKYRMGGCLYCTNEQRHQIALKALRKRPQDLQQLMAIEILLQDAPNKTLQELYDYFDRDFPQFTHEQVRTFMNWGWQDNGTGFSTAGMTMTLQKAFEIVNPDNKWSQSSWDRPLYPHARRYFALRALDLTASASSAEIRNALRCFRRTQHSDKGGDHGNFVMKNPIMTASANFLLLRKPPQTNKQLKELEDQIRLLEKIIPMISDTINWQNGKRCGY